MLNVTVAGNSLGVILPKELLERLRVGADKSLRLSPRHGDARSSLPRSVLPGRDPDLHTPSHVVENP